MQDPSNGLHACTVFSKIDLVKGYRQSLSQLKTFQKLQLLRHLVCLNIFTHLLAYPMPPKLSKE
jgi:hypothetical protein